MARHLSPSRPGKVIIERSSLFDIVDPGRNARTRGRLCHPVTLASPPRSQGPMRLRASRRPDGRLAEPRNHGSRGDKGEQTPFVQGDGRNRRPVRVCLTAPPYIPPNETHHPAVPKGAAIAGVQLSSPWRVGKPGRGGFGPDPVHRSHCPDTPVGARRVHAIGSRGSR
mgnify:CR=1 FL=1